MSDEKPVFVMSENVPLFRLFCLAQSGSPECPFGYLGIVAQNWYKIGTFLTGSGHYPANRQARPIAEKSYVILHSPLH
jgi:hypothetical protein